MSRRGFSMAELVVTMAIFGVFLLILVGLETHFRRFERATTVELMTHPDNVAVISRLRRDVLDSTGYPVSFEGVVQTPSSLILSLPGEGAKSRTVVWTFDGGRATRRAFLDTSLEMEWTANGVPRYEIGSYEMPDTAVAVRLVGRGPQEQVTIDQIFTPRRSS